jgi:hypothetical protein
MITEPTADLNETASDAAVNAVDDEPMSNRRRLLRTLALGAAGAAAAGAAVALGNPGTAAADDGDPLTVGATNTHASATNVNYSGATQAASFNIQSGDQTAANDGILNGLFANAGTTLLGVASGNGNQNIGITGWSKKPLGTGVVGFTGGAGAYGGEFFGGLAEVRLRPGGEAPITLTNAHAVGELYEDATGELWLCTAAGSPGTWRQIAGPTTAGAFHAISPRRVYDSREVPAGKLSPNEDRVLSVANSTDGTLDVVPPFATAVTLTFTVTGTEGTFGYVSVRPEGTPYQNTSSINWFGPDQNLATTVVTALGGDRQISVLGAVARTHIVIDVVGFYR